MAREDARDRGVVCDRRSRTGGGSAVLAVGMLVTAILGAGGCVKRVELDATGVDLSDGRKMEVRFEDGSSLAGVLVPGNMVRYTSNDSLFDAEIGSVDEDVIELSRRVLLADLREWSELQRATEESETISVRPELDGAILLREDVQSVALLEPDARRMVSESVFWVAAVVAVGFAATSR